MSEYKSVVTRLSALAQATRLRVFRLLIEAGATGIPATEIAERLDVRRNLMSTHLNILASAGLTTTRREGRRIYHAGGLAAVNQHGPLLRVSLEVKRHPQPGGVVAIVLEEGEEPPSTMRERFTPLMRAGS